MTAIPNSITDNIGPGWNGKFQYIKTCTVLICSAFSLSSMTAAAAAFEPRKEQFQSRQ